MNYGLARDLQIHGTVPLGYDVETGESAKLGVGDLELGAKYRFLSQTHGNWKEQVAIYPLLEIPTGNPNRGQGTGHVQAFLPLWAQVDSGAWTMFGGAGYWLNPGPGNRNYWFTGAVLERRIYDRLVLGVELFHQTSDASDAPGSSGFDVGGTYRLSDHLAVLISVGRGFGNAASTNTFSYYAGLQVIY